MNQNKNFTKILIIYHELIFCKLTFYLHKNNKLHILNINYYKLIFKKFLKLDFESKIFNIYM